MSIAELFNHEKYYLGLTHASSIPWILNLLSVVTGTEDQFILEAIVKQESIPVRCILSTAVNVVGGGRGRGGGLDLIHFEN